MADPSSHNASLRAGQVVLPITLVALVACSDLAVLVGLRTRLDKLPVTSISASLVGKGAAGAVTALAPGASARLVIVATTQDGKQLVTAGAGHGKVLLDSFVFTPNLVQLGKRGKVSLPADPRLSDGKVASIHIATVGHPDVVTDLDIAVRYDVAFVANFSGSGGMNGVDGNNGLDGSPGADATPSIDPTTGLPGPVGPGGNGGDGGAGGNGGNGWDGAPGAAVHVWLRLKPGSDRVLQAKVTGKGTGDARDLYYLIDAKGGSLKVTADGGSGGEGGAGGRGGRGGPGGVGNPSGLSGRDGTRGFDGWRGNDGAAGTITVSVDPAAQQFVSILSLSNRSGSGRPGPAPIFMNEPVPPLW